MQATKPNNLYSRISLGGGGGGGGGDSSSDSYEVAQVTGRGGVYSGSRAIIEKIGIIYLAQQYAKERNC